MWNGQNPGDPRQWNKPSPTLSGLAGIAAICVVIGSYVFGAYFRDNRSEGAKVLDSFLGPVAKLIPQETLPVRIDEVTEFVRFEHSGNVMRYFFEVSFPKDEFYEANKKHLMEVSLVDGSFKDNLLSNHCPRLREIGLFEVGGKLDSVFNEPDGTVLGIIETSESSCNSQSH